MPKAVRVRALVLDPRKDDEGRPTRPQTWHTVVGLPGFYFPGEPTPIEGIGEATLEQAQAAHDDAGNPLAIVDIDEKQAAERREAHAKHMREARNALSVVRANAEDAAEVIRANDEAAALGEHSEGGDA